MELGIIGLAALVVSREVIATGCLLVGKQRNAGIKEDKGEKLSLFYQVYVEGAGLRFSLRLCAVSLF